MKKIKIVRNAADWKKMAGDTNLEKRLNSYLTCEFILTKNVRYNECLEAARDIINILNTNPIETLDCLMPRKK